jgi:DNA modification methylase
MAKHNEPKFLKLSIESIELPDWNPREISAKEFKKLQADIKKDPEFLKQRPPLINHITTENRYICYAGNQRVKAAAANGEVGIWAWVQEDVPKQTQDSRMLKDNLHRGQWDFEKLEAFGVDFLSDVGFEMKDLFKLNQSNSKENAKKSLTERFIIPPFSVIDTRQGYWQDRKKKWFEAGIASHESREDMEVSGSLSGSVPGYYDKKNKTEKILGKELSSEEFERDYLPDLMPNKSTLSYTNNGGLLSTFDPVLCEVLYSWFCPKNAFVLDPFAGGSVRGIVAGMLGLEYIGIDLRTDQVEANKRQLTEFNLENVNWMQGDSSDINIMIQDDIKFDFVFSCPPYFNLEKYSKDEKDLSNMSDEQFVNIYRKIIQKSVNKLRDNRFACFVVGNVRSKNGFYKDLVAETVEAFEDSGAKYYNEIVLLNVAGSTPIRAGKQFEKYRKVGKVHQNILVFYKGDPKAIATEFEWIINIENSLKEQQYEPNIAPAFVD